MLSSDEKPKALPLRPVHSSFLRLMGLLALTVMPSFLSAVPDFTQSVITASAEEPVEGDVVRFTVNLKNSGDSPAESAELTIEGPLTGFLIGTGGLNEPVIDPEAQKVSASLSLLPGAEKQIWVDVLTPRDSGADALTLAVHLAHYESGAELWDRKTISVDTRLWRGLFLCPFATAGLLARSRFAARQHFTLRDVNPKSQLDFCRLRCKTCAHAPLAPEV